MLSAGELLVEGECHFQNRTRMWHKDNIACLTKEIKTKCLHSLFSRRDACNYLALLGQTTNYEDVSCGLMQKKKGDGEKSCARKQFPNFPFSVLFLCKPPLRATCRCVDVWNCLTQMDGRGQDLDPRDSKSICLPVFTRCPNQLCTRVSNSEFSLLNL